MGVKQAAGGVHLRSRECGGGVGRDFVHRQVGDAQKLGGEFIQDLRQIAWTFLMLQKGALLETLEQAGWSMGKYHAVRFGGTRQMIDLVLISRCGSTAYEVRCGGQRLVLWCEV